MKDYLKTWEALTPKKDLKKRIDETLFSTK